MLSGADPPQMDIIILAKTVRANSADANVRDANVCRHCTKYAAVFIGMGREYNVCQVQNFMVIDVKFSMILLWCWLQ